MNGSSGAVGGAPVPAGGAGTQVLAGRGRRLVGALIDGLIVFVILIPILILTGVFRALVAGRSPTFSQHAESAVGFCVVWLLLNGSRLAQKGQSIGKAAVGTKIVTLQGGLPPFTSSAILRTVVPAAITQIPILGGLFGLVDIFWIFGRERRCLHDHIAGTRVVRA